MPERPTHSIDAFRDLTGSTNGLSTERIVSLLDEADFWDDDVLADVEREYKFNFVRKMLGRLHNDDGQRLFVNVEVDDGKGRKTRVYKNRQRMSVDEFRQAIRYYSKMGHRGLAMARSLATDCSHIHGVQLQLNFPGS